MSKLRNINLEEAGKVFVISNTPLFLIKKLRSLPEVAEIGRTFSGEEIFSELRAIAGMRPKTLSDAAKPYVLLVALWMKDSPGYLKKAADITLEHGAEWFAYAQNFLSESYRATSVEKFDLKEFSAPDIAISSSSANSTSTIKISAQ